MKAKKGNWKRTLILYLFASLQLLFLFGAWFSRLLVVENGAFISSVVVLLIGLFGGYASIRYENASEPNEDREFLARIVGALVTVTLTFLAFIPISWIFLDGYHSAGLLVIGFFSPAIITRVLSKS